MVSSSSASERFFSKLGWVKNARRNRLSRTRTEKLLYVHYNLMLKERRENPDHMEDPVHFDLSSRLEDDGCFIEIGETGLDELELEPGCNLCIVGMEDSPENLVSASPTAASPTTGTPLRRSPRRAAGGPPSAPSTPQRPTRAFDSEDDDVPFSQLRQPPRRTPAESPPGTPVPPTQRRASPRRSPRINSPSM